MRIGKEEIIMKIAQLEEDITSLKETILKLQIALEMNGLNINITLK